MYIAGRHRAIRADFSGGQITSDAGLPPLRAFDQRYGLTLGLAERVCDDRDDSRVSHPGLSLLRQRLYQIIAGYEDANKATQNRARDFFSADIQQNGLIAADRRLGAFSVPWQPSATFPSGTSCPAMAAETFREE